MKKKTPSPLLSHLSSTLLFLFSLQAGAESLTGGTLSITYDGAAFADASNSNFGLSASAGDFMRYGRFWPASETVGDAPFYLARQPGAFRPLPITTPSGNPRRPNFRDDRVTLEPIYPMQSPSEILAVNGNGAIDLSAGRNRLATDFSYDPSDFYGTASGLVQTSGVSAWWFANDALMDAGVAWISWGDLSLRYDPTRVALGYSGWVFANQLGGIGDIFDTTITAMTASADGISLRGELYGSDGTSTDPYNENQATWETYTLMNPNVKIGTFSFYGVTAVPEPGRSLMAGVATVCLMAMARRKFAPDPDRTARVERPA
jgi:hypothetical protein